jgi:RimJ/RimL family protein N-acetyltransferase
MTEHRELAEPARRAPSVPTADAAKYSAVERLRDDGAIEIRALRPDDRAGILAAISHASPRTLYRRFFGPRRELTERELAYFLNVDFVNHVALVATAQEGGRPVVVGGSRYVVLAPGKAELAFSVVDQHQGRGIATVLMRHLAAIARQAGLTELIAEVLPENAPMLKVFERSGLRPEMKRDSGVVHVVLHLA